MSKPGSILVSAEERDVHLRWAALLEQIGAGEKTTNTPPPLPMPEVCPVTLDELLGDVSDRICCCCRAISDRSTLVRRSLSGLLALFLRLG
jgi:hypothetical protein